MLNVIFFCILMTEVSVMDKEENVKRLSIVLSDFSCLVFVDDFVTYTKNLAYRGEFAHPLVRRSDAHS